MLVRDPRGEQPDFDIPPLPAGRPEGWWEALRDLLRPFYMAVAGARDPKRDVADYPTLREAARSIEFVDAVIKSSASEKWIAIGT